MNYSIAHRVTLIFSCNIFNYLIYFRDLSKNDIYAIEANIFKNLTNLKRLNLSQNDITFIGENSFDGLGNLERL